MNPWPNEQTPQPLSEQSIDQLNHRKIVWEVRAAPFEAGLKILALAFVIAFSLGAMLIFAYFMRHHFYAGGISASDTVSMALTSAAFVVLVTVLLLFASKVMYSLAWAMTQLISWTLDQVRRWKDERVRASPDGGINTSALSENLNGPLLLEWKSTSWGWLLVSTALLALAIFLLAAGPIGLVNLFSPILAGGLWLSWIFNLRATQLYCEIKKTEQTNFVDKWMAKLSLRWRNAVVSLLVIVSLLFVGGFAIQDLSLMIIGFREQNVSVRFTKEDFRMLVNEAARAGESINPCEPFIDEDFVVHGVDVLWHRLGSNGLLRYPTRPIGYGEQASAFSFQFEPPNANFTVLRTTGLRAKCSELPGDVVFKGKGATLDAAAKTALRRVLVWIADLPKEQGVRVAWHDSQPKGDDGGAENNLREERFQALRSFLMDTYHLPASAILIVDSGAEEPKLPCPQEAGPTRQFCERINRRIEVSEFSPNAPIILKK